MSLYQFVFRHTFPLIIRLVPINRVGNRNGIRQAMTADIEELSDRTDGEFYTFDVTELPAEIVKNVTSDKLLSALSRVCSHVSRGVEKRPYDKVREPFIKLNKALNVQGKIAPRFRPYISSGPSNLQTRTPEQNQISNDLQVLDLHWLWCRQAYDHNRLQDISLRWHSLFGKEFDIEAAEHFVGTAGDMQKKAVDILHLKPSEEIELRMIQSKGTRSWWSDVRKQRAEVSHLIQNAMAQSDKLQGKKSQHEQVWLAYKCKSKAKIGRIPDWYELISGKTMPRTTISTMKSRVDRLKRSAA